MAVTLQNLRESFVKKVGNFLLVGKSVDEVTGLATPDFSVNAGADFYIHAAIAWWDEQVARTAVTSIDVGSGDKEVSLAGLPYSSIRNVSYLGVPLTPVSKEKMQEYQHMLNADPAALVPDCWSVFRKMDIAGSVDTYTLIPDSDPPAYEKTSATIPVETDYLALSPYPVDDISLEIEYTLKYPPLITGQSNWWSNNHSEKVVYVASMLYYNLDVTADGSTILSNMVNSVVKSVVSPDIVHEIALNGTVMKG